MGKRWRQSGQGRQIKQVCKQKGRQCQAREEDNKKKIKQEVKSRQHETRDISAVNQSGKSHPSTASVVASAKQTHSWPIQIDRRGKGVWIWWWLVCEVHSCTVLQAKKKWLFSPRDYILRHQSCSPLLMDFTALIDSLSNFSATSTVKRCRYNYFENATPAQLTFFFFFVVYIYIYIF